MADTARAQKIADRIKTLTAENLESIVKDPDLGFVTITDVRVTGDLQHASLFYTVFGDAGQRAQTARLLELNKGKLRSFVGKQLGIRLTPSLEFIADAIPETAAHLEDLLREARERDAAVAAAAAGAVHAGEADPYKKDREDDEDEARGRGCRRLSRRAPRPRPTASSSSTSRRAGPATTSSRGPAGCAPPARSGTPAPSTRWRPGCSCSASAGPPGCSPSSSAATRTTRPRSGSGRRRSPTTRRVTSRHPWAPRRRARMPWWRPPLPLTGDIEQVPSAVSAIKVKGERAYHRVRSGESVELAARPVTVSRFVVGDTRAAEVDGIAGARRRRRGHRVVRHLRAGAGA